MDRTADFYSRPSHDFSGGGFSVFAGSRRQRGGGIFGSLKNFFMPVAKNLGKSLLSHGLGLARDVTNDALAGKNIKSSLMDRGKAQAVNFGKNVAREGVDALSNMVGRGSRRVWNMKRIGRGRSQKRKRKAKRKILRRSVSRKTTSRKRKARSHSTHRRKVKRRRKANF